VRETRIADSRSIFDLSRLDSGDCMGRRESDNVIPTAQEEWVREKGKCRSRRQGSQQCGQVAAVQLLGVLDPTGTVADEVRVTYVLDDNFVRNPLDPIRVNRGGRFLVSHGTGRFVDLPSVPIEAMGRFLLSQMASVSEL
jgi:hypothetical protein